MMLISSFFSNEMPVIDSFVILQSLLFSLPDIEMEPSAQPAVSKTAGVFDKDAHSRSSITVISLTTKFTIFIYILSIMLCLWSI